MLQYHRYQVAALELIKASELEADKSNPQWTRRGAVGAGQLKKRFSVPHGPDLAKDHKYANQAASWGLEVHLNLNFMSSRLVLENQFRTFYFFLLFVRNISDLSGI